MARKLNKNLVALSSAAIAALYGIGYARTIAPAHDTAGPATLAAALASPQPSPSDTATAVARAVAAALPTHAATHAATPAATHTATQVQAAAYRDGVYTGSGTSCFGGFDVAVTVQSGEITGVELTKVTTKYPAARIAQLPGQVVQRQSAAVDLVSGATNSARAFKDAVTQALAKAATGAASTAAAQG